MREWPLTGRADELDAVAAALADERDHAGIAVTGAAGVGKTRLAREAARIASARGAVVRWVAGTVAAQSVPLGAFAQWADRLDGHPLQLVGQVIAGVIESPDGAPVVMCVDDAHRLDDLSAFVLHQLVLRRAAAVIATIRTGEAVPDAVTALWKDGHLHRLDLQPLPRSQSDALLENVLGGPVEGRASARLWQLTQGNVLFLREIVRHELQSGRLSRGGALWSWEGPLTMSAALVELVGLQLGATAEPLLDVVDLVALGEPLELAHLTTLADAAAIEEAEHRGLIAVAGSAPSDVVRLGHPLFGEVRLARAGRWRLARLRGRLAQTIGESSPVASQVDPVRLALLLLGSDLPPDAALFTRAAAAAMQRVDMVLTAELAAAAVRAGAGLDAEMVLANALSVTSRGEDAEQVLAGLTARELPDDAWTMAVLLRAANLLWTLSRPAESASVIDDALAVAGPGAVDALRAFQVVQLAIAGCPADAVTAGRAVARDGLAPLPTMMLAWGLVIALGDLGRPLEAGALADAAAELAATTPEVAFQGAGLVIFYTHALAAAGHVTAVRALVERTAGQLADVPGAARTIMTALRGYLASVEGDARTAVELLDTAVAEFDQGGSTVGTEYFFGVAHVRALALSGDGARAQAALERVERGRHRSFTYLEPDLLLAAAWTAAANGHLAQARALASQAADFAATHGQPACEVSCLQAAIQFGERPDADRAAALAQRVTGPRASLVARWAAALARHDGDGLVAVSADLHEMGDRIAAADAAAHAATAHYRGGRRGAALTASSRATALLAQCSARTPATEAAIVPLSLSDREREVALLLSKGLSNREIAASLTVSVRTVEGHVYQACRKLGVTRSQLAGVFG